MAKETSAAGPVAVSGVIMAARVVDNPVGYMDVEIRSPSAYIDHPSEGAPTITHRVVLTNAEWEAFGFNMAVVVMVTPLTADP